MTIIISSTNGLGDFWSGCDNQSCHCGSICTDVRESNTGESKTDRSAGQRGCGADRAYRKGSSLQRVQKEGLANVQRRYHTCSSTIWSRTYCSMPPSSARRDQHHRSEKMPMASYFITSFIQMAESKGSGWVNYMFPKPGETQASQKWAYVMGVNVNGVPSLVASGFYPE